MTSMIGDQNVLQADARGQMRVSAERREALLDETIGKGHVCLAQGGAGWRSEIETRTGGSGDVDRRDRSAGSAAAPMV